MSREIILKLLDLIAWMVSEDDYAAIQDSINAITGALQHDKPNVEYIAQEIESMLRAVKDMPARARCHIRDFTLVMPPDDGWRAGDPVRPGEYLVKTETGILQARFGCIKFARSDGSYHYWWSDITATSISDVTHWRELPPPPEVKP